MIDVESEVFTEIASRLREQFPGIYVTGEYIPSPPTFPCVSVIEEENVSFPRSEDSSSNENHASVLYEVNVYSNKQSGKKRQCRSIASVVDETFNQMGFSRSMLRPVDNFADATIYRMIGRYKAVVSDDKMIYGR